MSFSYLSTIYKSYYIVSAVQARLKLDELSEIIDQYLLVAKPNSIEIFYLSKDERVDSLFEIPLNADLIHINKIPSSNPNEPDMIFILTDDMKYIFCHISKTSIDDIKYSGELEMQSLNMQTPKKIIMYQSDKLKSDKNIIQSHKRHQKHVKESLICDMPIEEEKNSVVKSIPITSIKNSGYIIIYGNENDLKVIPWKEAAGITVSKPFSVKLDDTELIDIVPLYKERASSQEIHLGFLVKDELSHFYKEIVFDERSQKVKVNLNDGWNVRFPYPVYRILSLSNGGILAFLENNIWRDSKKETFRKIFAPQLGECIFVPGLIDLYFFSDMKTGSLYLLSPLNDQSANSDNFVKTLALGHIGEASCLCYLGEKKLFVGSELDNSCFVRIPDAFTMDKRDPYIEKIASLGNLSNIWSLDLISGDTNQKIITVSPEKSHPLNVFHIGAGLEIENSIDFRQNALDIFVHENKFIFVIINIHVLCFLKDDRTGRIYNEKFEVLNNSKYLLSFSPEIIVKIADYQMLLLKIVQSETGIIKLEQVFIKAYEHKITKAIIFDNVLIISSNEKKIFIFLIIVDKDGSIFIQQVSEISTGLDVSAIAFSSNFKADQLLFYNCWFSETLEVCDYLNPGELKCSIPLPNQEVHSMIITNSYILIGNKDGSVLYCTYSSNKFEQGLDFKLSIIRILIIGPEPVTLVKLPKQGTFALSKNIAILNIYSERIDKVFINSTDIIKIAEIEFNNKNYLLSLKNSSLEFCTVERSQKYIISPYGKFDFGSQKDWSLHPEDVLIEKELNMVIVAVNPGCDFKKGNKSAVLFFDQTSEDKLNMIEINQEIITALYVNREMILIGTDIENNKNKNIYGKIHLYSIISREKFLFCKSINLGNSISSIKKLSGNNYVVGSGQEIKVFEIKKDIYLGSDIITRELCTKNISTIILNIDVKNDIILVSDPLKNLTLFKFESHDNRIYVIGRETSIGKSIYGMFYNNMILQSDQSNGLNMFYRTFNSEYDLEKLKLKTLGRINLGERLLCGKIFPLNNNAQQLTDKEKAIFCSDKGSLIGLIPLREEDFNLLFEIQEILVSQYKKGFLCLEYQKWRAKWNKEHKKTFLKVIDGDLFKNFIELPIDYIEGIFTKNNIHTSPQEFIALIDNIERNLFF